MATETKGTATYSPEDNKIRFYPDSRLPREEYDRVRAAGFIWAPKQGLFVAPMWTPDREDLMVEWCGEVGDEDKSLVERAEERAERFEGYSDSRRQDAEAAHKTVEGITEHIPMGQPILVGHHSERHARRDAERIQSGMRKCVDAWEQSEYWTRRAQAAVKAAKYKEVPAVRARRIKKLEAEKRGMERRIETLTRHREFFSKDVLTREQAIEFLNTCGGDYSRSYTLAEFPRTFHTYEGSMSLWSALGGGGPEEEAIITVEFARKMVLEDTAIWLKGNQRWLDHYNNRIAYESEMLKADGGIATDQTRPEVGGAIKCWASKSGALSIIKKVNKVSVTVLDNWGNGGPSFTRTIRFDECKGVLPKATVEQLLKDGKAIQEESSGALYLLEHVSKPSSIAPKEVKTKFEAMKEQMELGVQVVTSNQLFPTPVAIAARMVEESGIMAGARVLEPSAGTGVIVKQLIEHGIFRTDVTAVEINPELCKALPMGVARVCGDFLKQNGNLGKFDAVVMNPPFENGSDIKHILHARSFLEPGGKVVAICAGGTRQEEALRHLCETWELLPAGTFKESGTEVNTVLLVMEV